MRSMKPTFNLRRIVESMVRIRLLPKLSVHSRPAAYRLGPYELQREFHALFTHSLLGWFAVLEPSDLGIYSISYH